MANQPRGIKWSAPVLIKKVGGENRVVVPKQVAEALDAGVGDVLNFTQLPDGCIEVWRVKQGTYASLDDMGAQTKSTRSRKAAPAKKAKPAKKGGKRK